MEIKMSETVWETVGFTAAPDGWRVTYRTEGHDLGRRQYRSAPVAGWLIQESGPASTPGSVRRRVIAAFDVGQGELRPVDAEPLPFGACQWSTSGPSCPGQNLPDNWGGD